MTGFRDRRLNFVKVLLLLFKPSLDDSACILLDCEVAIEMRAMLKYGTHIRFWFFISSRLFQSNNISAAIKK